LGTLRLLVAVATPLADLVGLDPVDALDHPGVAADVRTDLVLHGPFRWVRNPIFSSTAVTITVSPSPCPTWSPPG
jgi:hypothetical protein